MPEESATSILYLRVSAQSLSDCTDPAPLLISWPNNQHSFSSLIEDAHLENLSLLHDPFRTSTFSSLDLGRNQGVVPVKRVRSIFPITSMASSVLDLDSGGISFQLGLTFRPPSRIHFLVEEMISMLPFRECNVSVSNNLVYRDISAITTSSDGELPSIRLDSDLPYA